MGFSSFDIFCPAHDLVRKLDADLQAGEAQDNDFAQVVEHGFEQAERLLLVFVERIALRVGTQVDALAQMVEREQVVFPELVERL